MSQPTFYSDGTTPRRTDSKHVISVKWLGAVQNNSVSPVASNNPIRTDAGWTTTFKTLKAVQNSLGGSADSSNNPSIRDTKIVLLRKIDAALDGVPYPG